MQKITPHLWFDKEAREAAEFYCSVFPNSKITNTTTLDNTPSGKVDVVSFELDGESFQAISAGPFFKFNEAISFIVNCSDQAEVDYYWEKLSADPKSEQCGWLKDKFGLSWQIVPTRLGELMTSGHDKAERVMQALLKMKKIEIEPLEKAYEGEE